MKYSVYQLVFGYGVGKSGTSGRINFF